MTAINSSIGLTIPVTCAALALVIASAQPATQGGAPPPSLSSTGVKPKYANVAYASTSATQKLDIYVPTSGNRPFPVVVDIHGGGFRLGSKDEASAAINGAFLKAGFAVVPINYRLSGEAVFPAAVQDSSAAVRFLRANAAKYNLDPKRIAASGASAGANLAALLGTAGDTKTFVDPALGNANVSAEVQAVIALFPPVDFSVIDAELKAQGCAADTINHDTAQGFESLYLGAALPTVPEKVKAANPITYISKNDPPFLLQNGDQDCNVGSGQSKLLYDALTKAGVKASYEQFKNTGHGGATFETAENTQKLVKFLRDTLK
jgi:acetyl esterase/lipase